MHLAPAGPYIWYNYTVSVKTKITRFYLRRRLASGEGNVSLGVRHAMCPPQ